MTYEVAKEAVASSVAWGVAEVLPFGSQAAGGVCEVVVTAG